MFDKILIANRGEIACRIIQTARRLGIKTVAVYSDADAKARPVRLADQAVHIGGAASRESYLKGDIIIEAALATGAQAIHPGYGFLSENEAFSAACAKAGIVFIGPSPQAINAMGLKDRAKAIMQEAGVPVVPGYQGENQEPAFLLQQADKIGYPVLIKAVAGGGGKGMRLVEDGKDFEELLASCQREAQNSFGNPHVLIEKYIQQPRHVEVQVFGDSHGNAVSLWERDCSLQRRHQKVVEEAPAPGLRDDVRKALGAASVKAVKALKYTNAGTLEFIMDSKTQDFFFMEMNTRLQVEHPVTEAITGLDLVEWQLRIAAGEALPLAQKDIPLHGHAFEVRLYAEDPSNSFLPQTGKITELVWPVTTGHSSAALSSPQPILSSRSAAEGSALVPANTKDGNRADLSAALRDDNQGEGCIRIDTGVEAGDSVTIHYDPMIAKIITHGATREAAIETMRRALADTIVGGLTTNQEFLGNIFRQPDFIAGRVDTGFIARHEGALLPASYGRPEPEDLALAAMYFFSPAPSSRRTPGPSGQWAEDPGMRRDDDGWDVWSAADNWRLNGTLSRPLVLQNRGETIRLTVSCSGRDFTIRTDAGAIDVRLDSFDGSRMTARLDSGPITAHLLGDARDLTIVRAGRVVRLSLPDHARAGEDSAGGGRVTAPMPGKIINVMVKQGETVEKDQPLLVMEAMKMEMTIRAGCAGLIEDLPVAVNDQVGDGALLASIKKGEAA
jgi:3-methylcrotonyl-CoA carboxylase alpha subunit